MLVEAPIPAVAERLMEFLTENRLLRGGEPHPVFPLGKSPAPVVDQHSRYVFVSHFAQSLEEALAGLLPIATTIATRYVLASTANPPWVVCFNNRAWYTSDTALAAWFSESLGARCVSALRQEHTARLTPGGSEGDFGGSDFRVYREGALERSIGCICDGGPWVFSQAGAPYPFEQTERYKARDRRNRFVPDMVAEYLAALALFPFDDRFYTVSPTQPAAGVHFQTDDPAVEAKLGYLSPRRLTSD
jgi:hypothetical protein